MGRRAEPDYVSGVRGRYQVSPPVVHPPSCVCAICPHYRAAVIDRLRAAWMKDGRSFTDADLRFEVWSQPLTIRARRRCPKKIRDSRPAAAEYARKVKREEEASLVAAVEKQISDKQALANAVPFGRVSDAYRIFLQAEGKRYDRDRYRIDALERFFGRGRDVATVDRSDYERLKVHLTKERAAAPTIARYTTTLVAMMNNAVREGIIPDHRLKHLQRPKAKKKTKPVTFTRRQVAVLLGPAMDAYEREQAVAVRDYEREQERRATADLKPLTTRRPSVVPLRGFCLVAYLTLMRPDNNFDFRWERIQLHSAKDRGRYRLDEHKNASKGVEVEAGLHPRLVRYLRPIWPGKSASGLVHPNPETGGPYRNIRKQWARLIKIANEMLPSDEQLVGVREHFYTWRHTGASALAATGADPIMIVRMMGDVSLQTVMDHYFDSSVEHMQEILEKWEPIIDELTEGRGPDDDQPVM